MTSTLRLAAISLTALLNAPLGAGSSVATRAQTSRPPAEPVAAAGLSRLPPAAEAHVSEVLGRGHSSYHAVARPDGFRMDNPGHRLAAAFTAQGVEVRAGAETWSSTVAPP